MSAYLLRNPIFFLVLRGWQFAGKFRPALLLYFCMFTVAQAITLAEPFVIGKALNAVQTEAVHVTSGGALWHDVSSSLYTYFFIQLAFWLLHGQARCIERYAAFHIKANYKRQLFSIVTQLPVQWHR
jgi:ABC-type multidrug transport system fused ATPase/permease subunit